MKNIKINIKLTTIICTMIFAAIILPGISSADIPSVNVTFPNITMPALPGDTIPVSNGSNVSNESNETPVNRTLTLTSDKLTLFVGEPETVTFSVYRYCGTEQGEACIQIYPPPLLPVEGATVQLTSDGVVRATDTTDVNGNVIMPINATSEGTITVTASKDSYISTSITIEKILNQSTNQTNTTPTPTLTPTTTPNSTCLNVTKDIQTVHSNITEPMEFGTGNLSSSNKSWVVTWTIDGNEVHREADVTQVSTYVNSTPSEGTWNLAANATSGCDRITWRWTWTVLNPPNKILNLSSYAGDSIKFNSGNLTYTGRLWDFKWYINGTEVFNESNASKSTFVKTSEIGYWNLTVIATNNSNTLSWGWLWTVTSRPSSSGGSSGGSSGSGGSGGGGSSGGGGGGGGGVVSGEKYANIVKSESRDNDLKLQTPVTYTFTNPMFSIYQVDITGKTNEGDISLRIERLRNVSSLVSRNPAGTIYAYENLWINSKKIDKATIRFRVNNSWFDSNNIDKNDIKLLHYETSGGWKKLNAKIINTDSNYTYYQSMAPGLSPFAISAIKDTTQNNQTNQVSNTPESYTFEDTQNPVTTEIPTETATAKTPGLELPYVIAILFLIAIIFMNAKRK